MAPPEPSRTLKNSSIRDYNNFAMWLTDFRSDRAIDFHDDRQAAATIVLTRVENPLAYGIVITSKTGK